MPQNYSRTLHARLRQDLSQIHRDYEQQVFLEMDNDPHPVSYRREQERAVFYSISTGNLGRIEQFIIPSFEGEMVVGTLSERPREQMLFLFISSITLCTRAAIDGGLPETHAYALSDSYIRYASHLTDVRKLQDLSSYAMYDFTKAVYDHRFRGVGAIVRTCCDYIQRHMHDAVTLQDLAAVCSRTPNYISDLFAKELGLRPTAYIRKQKLDYARNVLEISDLPVSAISDLLAFPSTSSFIAYFKKEYGVSPLHWRNETL